MIIWLCFSLYYDFFLSRLSVIEEVLGKALERVNMDLVFLEDSEHSDLSMAMAGPADSPHLLYHNTTAYVFTWLLIIEAMSHCDPEVPLLSSPLFFSLSLLSLPPSVWMRVFILSTSAFQTRGALSEWMKELSLFDHLLHGLLKFLNESSKGPSELKGRHEDLLLYIYDANGVHVFNQIQCMIQFNARN